MNILGLLCVCKPYYSAVHKKATLTVTAVIGYSISTELYIEPLIKSC